NAQERVQRRLDYRSSTDAVEHTKVPAGWRRPSWRETHGCFVCGRKKQIKRRNVGRIAAESSKGYLEPLARGEACRSQRTKRRQMFGPSGASSVGDSARPSVSL